MTEIGLPKASLDTPSLWVDLDLLDQNIRLLAERFRAVGVDWRPHTKGIKIPALAHKAIAAGAIGVTCAKLGEAEVMAAAGVKDILIANQIVGPQKISRLVNLCRHADIKVAVDNPKNVVELGAAALGKGVEIGVLVDVNCGMDRTGVMPGAPTVALSRLVHETPGLRYLGLMSWEGHALAEPDPTRREAEIKRAIALVAESVAQCRADGLPVTIVSGGGSGTVDTTPFLSTMTEIQAGGGIFCDVRYRAWGTPTQPSLFVRAMVTSHPAPERVIFDVGFKSLPRWSGPPEPIGITNMKDFSTSAEHGVMTLDGPNETIQIGDTFDFIVGYGDATVFLYETLYGVRDGLVETAWPIQGRGKLR